MAELQDFVGTWHRVGDTPHSTHTFIWTIGDDGLRGEWVIDATAPPPGSGMWMSNPRPRRHEMQIGPPTIDDGRALFTVNSGPYITEFRLLGDGEAIVGAAPDKIPPEFSGPEFERSIEGHRFRVRRVPGDISPTRQSS